jgi:hypothetical protein
VTLDKCESDVIESLRVYMDHMLREVLGVEGGFTFWKDLAAPDTIVRGSYLAHMTLRRYRSGDYDGVRRLLGDP